MENDTYAFTDMDVYNETINDNAIYSFFDSSNSELMISNLYYDDLIKRIFDYTERGLGRVQTNIESGKTRIDCGDKVRLPVLYFLIKSAYGGGNYWL